MWLKEEQPPWSLGPEPICRQAPSSLLITIALFKTVVSYSDDMLSNTSKFSAFLLILVVVKNTPISMPLVHEMGIR